MIRLFQSHYFSLIGTIEAFQSEITAAFSNDTWTHRSITLCTTDLVALVFLRNIDADGQGSSFREYVLDAKLDCTDHYSRLAKYATIQGISERHSNAVAMRDFKSH